jgi:acyl carrier protein
LTEQEVRNVISAALQYASVPDFAGSARQARFLAGDDVRFDELEIDSLAAMELCIAIELELGVSITPADLPEIGSLVALVRRVQETIA